MSEKPTDRTPASPSKRSPALMISIVMGMVMWTLFVTLVLYADFGRFVQRAAGSAAAQTVVQDFLHDEAPGYIILWVIGLTSMTVMRLRLKRYLRSLERANAHLDADRARSERAEELASFGHWELDLGAKTFRGSRGAATIYGLHDASWSIALVQSIPLPEYRPILDQALADLIAGRGVYDVEFRIRRQSDGEIRDIHSIAAHDPVARLVTGMIHDVTAFNLTQRQLKESELRYRLLADNAIDVIWTADLEGRFTYVSPSIMQLRGITPEQAVTTSIEDAISPGSRDVVRRALRVAVEDALSGKNSEPVYIEVEQPRADGTTVWTEVITRILFDERGNAHGIQGVSRDISLRRAYREQLEMSLRDKDVLLREVHHRVKNNLQVISSLLNLQAESYTDPQARGLLKESQQRIRSMALVHEKLYRSPHMSSIDFSDYLSTMTRELVRSMGGVQARTQVSGDEIHLDIEKAIPAGLIVNELLTNALKHAFPPHIRDGEIQVNVLRDGPAVVLTVQDNGIGLPTDKSLEDMRTMGMTVIHGLTLQLEGTITTIPGPGAGFRLRFPLDHDVS